MLEQQRAARSRSSKCYKAAQVHLVAKEWADAIGILDEGLQEINAAGSQADDALLSDLTESLERASNALRERDMARLNAERLDALAQEAANDRRYEDMLEAYEEATGACTNPAVALTLCSRPCF